MQLKFKVHWRDKRNISERPWNWLLCLSILHVLLCKAYSSHELNTSPLQLMISQGLSPNLDVLWDLDFHFQLLAGHFHVHVPKRHHTSIHKTSQFSCAPNHSPFVSSLVNKQNHFHVLRFKVLHFFPVLSFWLLPNKWSKTKHSLKSNLLASIVQWRKGYPPSYFCLLNISALSFLTGSI